MTVYFGVLLLTAAFASTVIWSGIKRHWLAIRGLRQKIATCPVHQEVRFAITSIKVERASAVLHWPRPIREITRERQVPQQRSALRAA